jgi:hypothetical protein
MVDLLSLAAIQPKVGNISSVIFPSLDTAQPMELCLAALGWDAGGIMRAAAMGAGSEAVVHDR